MDFYNPADYNADNPRHTTVDLNFPKADVTPGEDIVVTATVTSGNNQWFADQIVYNPQKVTLDLDEKTAKHQNKDITADLPPLEFSDPLEFAPVVAKGGDTDYVYFVSFYYTGINKNYDKEKAKTLFRNGKRIADNPDEQIKMFIPDPNASDAFYVVVYFYNTEASLWEAYGIRYVSSYSMENNYEPEVLEKSPYAYGENESWKPKAAGE